MRRAPDGASLGEGQGDAAAPIRRRGARGLVPLVEISWRPAAALWSAALRFAAMLDLGGRRGPAAFRAFIHSTPWRPYEIQRRRERHWHANWYDRNSGVSLRSPVRCGQPCQDAYVRRLRVAKPAVWGPREHQSLESALQGLRLELAGREAMPSVPPRVHPTWIGAKLERLDELLRQAPAQAKAEIAKHLDGELTVRPLPSAGRERRAEVRGRAKLNSLLEGQEAVCGGVVAGAGFAECYTAPTPYWIDLVRR
jgi:hypothetical protein